MAGAMNLARNHRIADVLSRNARSCGHLAQRPGRHGQALRRMRGQSCARFIYDPGQQVARLNGDELRRGITGAFMVVVNIYEAERHL